MKYSCEWVYNIILAKNMSRFIEGPQQYFYPDSDMGIHKTIADSQPAYLGAEVLLEVKNPKPITPDTLWKDNKSSLARNLNDAWEEKRKAGELVAVWGCSEERRGRTLHTIAINSIGTGGNRASYRELLANPEYQHNGVVVALHYDALQRFSADFDPRKWITDCGGLKMYEKFSVENSAEETFPHDFVDYILKGIHHQDALVHGILSAEEIRANLLKGASQKPVGVMLEDHRGLLPDMFVAVWDRQNGFRRMLSTIDVDVLRHGNCRPEDLYKEGFYGLPLEALPTQFRNLLKEREEQQKQAREIHAALGQNIEEMHANHRAHAIRISTSIRGALTIPQHYGVYAQNMHPLPNRLFEIHIPKQGRKLSKHGIDAALAQASYPLGEATLHFGQENRDFSEMTTVIIETPAMDSSSEVARQLLSTPIGQEWQQATTGQIIIEAIRDGEIIDIDKFV